MKLGTTQERIEWATMAAGALAATGDVKFACAAADFLQQELTMRAAGKHDTDTPTYVAPGSQLLIPKAPPPGTKGNISPPPVPNPTTNG
jgi:hypothetical protein